MNEQSSQDTATSGAALWRILGTAHQLEARLETGLAAVGLSLAKLGVLRALADARESLTLGELAQHNRCVRSNITQLVDRLETDGLVRREHDPSDRRVRRAALTAAGRTCYEAGARAVAVWEEETGSALSPADAAALDRALGHLIP